MVFLSCLSEPPPLVSVLFPDQVCPVALSMPCGEGRKQAAYKGMHTAMVLRRQQSLMSPVPSSLHRYHSSQDSPGSNLASLPQVLCILV